MGDMLTHPRTLPVYWVVLSVLIFALDHLTGPYIQFPILFLIPVTLAAVYSGRWWGVGLAIVMPLIRCYFEIQTMPWAVTQEMINAVIRVIVLVEFAVLADQTSQQTRALKQEVKTLRGLLSICCFCKKIRKEDDTWDQVEKYITDRSEARFSHSLCPDCLEEHFPGFSRSKVT
jgi:K+-sensing histidine kinase KdpD